MAGNGDEKPGGAQVANLVGALLIHAFFGLPWLFFVAAFSWFFSDTAGVFWGLSGFVLWALGLVDAVRRLADPGAAWGAILRSWLWIIGGPIALAILGIRRLRPEPETTPQPLAPLDPIEEPVNPEVERRLGVLAEQIEALSRELAEIRRLAEGGETEPVATVPSEPPPQRATDWEPRVPAPKPPEQLAGYKPLPPPQPQKPSFWERDIDYGEFLGAKGLAWAGGLVTVLGVVFFFVLAVNRGWIGPTERVGLGGLASLLLFGAGVYVHRRYGPIYSAFGAVGAGLAGGYATLLAAAALYDLVPDLAALAIAAGIASVGVATSLLWSSELIAGIGLIGATLVPLMVLFEEDVSPLGTGFAGLVFAATTVVAVVKRWPTLLAVGFAASLPQIALLIEDGQATDWDRVILAWIFTALYVGAAVAFHRAADDDGLGSLPATFVVVSAVLAGATGFALFEGDDRGWIVVASGAAYGALAVVLFRDRDFSALLAAAGLALVAVGLAVVLSGPSLALAWAAEAAVLAWLARRIDEPRYQLAALVYLAAAAVHAIGIDAPPTDLYDSVTDPADGALAPLGVAVGAGIVAFYSRPWEKRAEPAGFFRFFEPLMRPFRESSGIWRTLGGWVGGAAAVYAASLAILELAQLVWSEPLDVEFERGHVAVTAFWGLTGAALVYVSRWFETEHVHSAGLALATATFIEAATFDVTFDENRRGWALVAAAVPLLLTALVEELPADAERPELSPWTLMTTLASAGLGTAGLYFVTNDEGWAWLGLAVVYAALAAWVFRSDRDFSTALWAPALAVGALAAIDLTDETWLVLSWSAVAAAVSVLGNRAGEERLQLGAAAYLLLALVYTLGELAPPDEFFRANDDPAVGVPALLFVVGALTVLIVFGLRTGAGAPYRLYAVAGAAVLAGYAVSLAILGAFEWAGTASVQTDFQRGHSAVSAFWGIVGLLTLYVGLSRALRALRLAGFALFGLALAKLFLYDLANLSSVTRALSFLAVGAVLLLAGFFYQRLTAAPDDA
jgi:uncharacterized membrane protein